MLAFSEPKTVVSDVLKLMIDLLPYDETHNLDWVYELLLERN